MLKILAAALTAILPLAAAESALPQSLFEDLRRSWPGNRTLHLVFHGHSVPAGYHVTPEVKPFDSYPLMTVEAIKKIYPHAVINGIVTAIGGEHSVSGAARFERDVLSMRPDVVFIDYALNDRRLPVAEVEAAWRSMAKMAKRNQVAVVFVTPTGAEDVRIGAVDEPLEIRAELVRKVAAEEEIPVVDAWANWKAELAKGTEQKELLSQINHPNRAGHQLVAHAIARLFVKP
jgi:acyl-CoA thioesterase-1